jgi:hypothetical protein
MIVKPEPKTKILIPANDNTGGRHIVLLQSDHCVLFPPKLREELSEGPEFSALPEGF